MTGIPNSIIKAPPLTQESVTQLNAQIRALADTIQTYDELIEDISRDMRVLIGMRNAVQDNLKEE